MDSEEVRPLSLADHNYATFEGGEETDGDDGGGGGGGGDGGGGGGDGSRRGSDAECAGEGVAQTTNAELSGIRGEGGSKGSDRVEGDDGEGEDSESDTTYPWDERTPSRVDDLAQGISTNAALFHLLKGFVGPGNLALPYAVANAGLIPATFGIVFCAFVFTYCVHCLIEASRSLCGITGRKTMDYGYTLQFALEYGPPKFQFLSKYAKKFVNITIGTMQLAYCTVYLVFIGDNVKTVVESSLFLGWPIQAYIVATFPFLLLVNLVRNVQLLSYVSLAGLTIQIVASVIIFQYIMRDTLSWDNLVFVETDITRYPIFISTTVFAFEGITVVLPIENKMREPEAMTAPFGIVNVGLTLLSTFYFAMAFFGYLRYGQDALGSISLNLPHDSLYGSLKILFSLVMLSSYAVQFMVAQEIFFGRIRKWISNPSNHDRWDIFIRVLVLVITVLVAAAIPHLGPFTSLVGGSLGIFVSIIFPLVIDLLHRWPRPDAFGRWYWRLYLDVFLLIPGIFCTFVGTISSIYAIDRSFDAA